MGRSLDDFFRRLHKAAAVQTLGGLSDRDLLERFLGSHDESAFTVLLERHGPMVYGVCRRASTNAQDAEDACQATFLVLARKASSLRKKESLGSWLHGVAWRMATGSKREANRRKIREARADPPPPLTPAAEVTWREVQAILDEELGRLPERYRAPLILCYLECLTRDAVAGRLGLSPGGLHGRLERGRDLLRRRLTHRGLTLTVLLPVSALGEGAACAALPPAFVVSSARAAALLAAGQPLAEVVSANVLTLTREVLTNMFLMKVKLGTAVVLSSLLLTLLGGSLMSAGFAQDTPPTIQAVQTKLESDKDFIRRISKDLRGADPSAVEVHFFVTSKDAGKRQKLIDLYIEERQAKQRAELVKRDVLIDLDATLMLRSGEAHLLRGLLLDNHSVVPASDWEKVQGLFWRKVLVAKNTTEVARITQSYLDQLLEFQKKQPDSAAAQEAIRQIVLIYESQGKPVESAAWRAKLGARK